jgi:hypothetical protein
MSTIIDIDKDSLDPFDAIKSIADEPLDTIVESKGRAIDYYFASSVVRVNIFLLIIVTIMVGICSIVPILVIKTDMVFGIAIFIFLGIFYCLSIFSIYTDLRNYVLRKKIFYAIGNYFLYAYYFGKVTKYDWKHLTESGFTKDTVTLVFTNKDAGSFYKIVMYKIKAAETLYKVIMHNVPNKVISPQSQSPTA